MPWLRGNCGQRHFLKWNSARLHVEPEVMMASCPKSSSSGVLFKSVPRSLRGPVLLSRARIEPYPPRPTVTNPLSITARPITPPPFLSTPHCVASEYNLGVLWLYLGYKPFADKWMRSLSRPIGCVLPLSNMACLDLPYTFCMASHAGDMMWPSMLCSYL